MSGKELNKIAASIFLASLIAMIVGLISNVLYRPKINIAERGYKIEVSASADGNAAAGPEEAPIDIPALMATANSKDAAQNIKKCIACHTLNEGESNKIGPNLWNVFGAAKGQHDGFKYSKALLAVGGHWDEESLFHFLHKPSQFIPGTKMSFAGLKNPQDIANVIQYFKENKK